MALTNTIAVERAFYRAAPRLSEAQAGIYRFEVESYISDALNELGDRVADSPNFVLLQQTFSVAISSDQGALPSTVVMRTIPKVGRVSSGSTVLQFLPYLQDLDKPRPQEFTFYTLRGNQIFVRGADGTSPGLFSVDIVAGYYPIIGQIPRQLEDDFIDILVERTLAKMGVSRAYADKVG